MVLELPPRLSFSSQVSTESLYGMKQCLLPPPPDRELLWLPTVLPSPSEAILLILWQLLDIWEFWAVEAVGRRGSWEIYGESEGNTVRIEEMWKEKQEVHTRLNFFFTSTSNWIIKSIFIYQEQIWRCPKWPATCWCSSPLSVYPCSSGGLLAHCQTQHKHNMRLCHSQWLKTQII